MRCKQRAAEGVDGLQVAVVSRPARVGPIRMQIERGRFEVVAARVATAPKYPQTLHYRGDGVFMLSGTNTRRYRRYFKPQNL